MQMNWLKSATLAAVAAGVLIPGSARAEMAPEASAEQLRNEMAAMQAKLAQLESRQNEDWMTERRAEEVKGLIREALQDAETRSSLLQSGISAGYDGGFFMAGDSDKGGFKLDIGAQLQFRWIANFSDDDTGAGDEFDAGFQLRRTKIALEAELYDDWTAELVLAADREDGSVGIEDFKIGYEINDEFDVAVGNFKLPFLREELLSSKRQLAVDRSLTTEFFTLDRSEQIQLGYSSGNIKAAIAISDGLDEEFSTIGADPVDFAITGRVDVTLMGSSSQGKDFVAWTSDDDTYLGVGAAVHYQAGDDDNADNSSESDADYLAWTVDALFKSQGLSVMGAVTGGDVSSAAPGVAGGERSPLGFLAQAGYMVTDKFQPFVRYDYIDPDGDQADFGAASEVDTVQALTFGANYYIQKHNLKLTGDVVWVFDGALPGEANDNADFGNSTFSDGLGFSGDAVDATDEDIFLVRLQLQLLF